MALDASFNAISHNCTFILSEIKNTGLSTRKQNKIRKAENKTKIPKPLTEVVSELERMYEDLYDVNLQVYKAEKDSTIIEVRYFLRSSLEEEYRLKTMTTETMLHCKVSIPPYASDTKERFDINWELGTPHHKWKMFWLILRSVIG